MRKVLLRLGLQHGVSDYRGNVVGTDRVKQERNLRRVGRGLVGWYSVRLKRAKRRMSRSHTGRTEPTVKMGALSERAVDDKDRD